MHPRPFGFRCEPDLHDEIDRRAAAARIPASEVIRQLLNDSLAGQSAKAMEARLERIEEHLDEVLLQNSQLARALGSIATQLRFGVEGIMNNLDPQNPEELQAWIERRFPPVIADGEVA